MLNAIGKVERFIRHTHNYGTVSIIWGLSSQGTRIGTIGLYKNICCEHFTEVLLISTHKLCF